MYDDFFYDDFLCDEQCEEYYESRRHIPADMVSIFMSKYSENEEVFKEDSENEQE